MPAKQIPLNKILTALDRKDRDFYDNLDDDEKKGFSPFLMLRYSSSVKGDPDLEHYYISNTNKMANKGILEAPLSQHPKLQWLMFTAVSPGVDCLPYPIPSRFHKWIKQKPKPKNRGSDIRKELAIMHPAMKDDDLDLLCQITTKKELKDFKKLSGE